MAKLYKKKNNKNIVLLIKKKYIFDVLGIKIKNNHLIKILHLLDIKIINF